MNNADYIQAAQMCAHSYDLYDQIKADNGSVALGTLIYGYGVVANITAGDALFGSQALGLGDRVWYGFLAQSLGDPTRYVAVIRGTQGSVEWLEDIEAQMVNGMHAGFASIYGSMEIDGQPIWRAIPNMLQPPATIDVYGHSLGSALATYLARDLALQLRSMGSTVRGVFLASPRPGSHRFAAQFDAAVGTDNYCVVNYLRDVVPRVPVNIPLLADFCNLNNVLPLMPADSSVKIPDNVHSNHQATSYLSLLQTRRVP
jgi:hypothetical protein